MFVERKIVNLYYISTTVDHNSYYNLLKIVEKVHFTQLRGPFAYAYRVFYFKDEKDETIWLLSCRDIPRAFSTRAVDNKISFKEAVIRKLQKDKSILFRPF